jgi:hypothetical protein
MTWMGHDLPPGARPRIIDAVTRNAGREPSPFPGWSR